jgi:endonuclease/exonuclease/phosphatase family metal-dependent hydrolase
LKPTRSLCALVAFCIALSFPRARAADSPREFVLAAYNLEDYFQSSDFPPGVEKTSKSPESIAAEIQVIQDIHPDILGVSEMGPPNEFADFRARLKAAGLDYPDAEYLQGPDPERHIALLSKFPIVSHQSLPDIPYQMDGNEEKVSRGFLDVTISVGQSKLRLIGVHLKSKLKDTPGDEAELRRNEANLLRQHVDQILNADPATDLIVYGDFNDTKESPSMRQIIGSRASPAALRDLLLKDADGDRWTELWAAQDVYSRIDYILVTRNLLPAVDYPRSSVYRSPLWNKASDHRPIIATFRLDKIQ